MYSETNLYMRPLWGRCSRWQSSKRLSFANSWKEKQRQRLWRNNWSEKRKPFLFRSHIFISFERRVFVSLLHSLPQPRNPHQGMHLHRRGSSPGCKKKEYGFLFVASGRLSRTPVQSTYPETLYGNTGDPPEWWYMHHVTYQYIATRPPYPHPYKAIDILHSQPPPSFSAFFFPSLLPLSLLLFSWSSHSYLFPQTYMYTCLQRHESQKKTLI